MFVVRSLERFDHYGYQSWYQWIRPHRPERNAHGLGSEDIDFVAVNDLTDTKTLAHLFKYDSVMGNLDHEIKAEGDTISVDGDSFKVFRGKNPAAIDWESVGAEIVIESTGRFTKAEEPPSTFAPVKKVSFRHPKRRGRNYRARR